MILIFIIAISLSMDAFSLSLAYGTIALSRREIKLLSFIVGLYHFFMPIFGMILGRWISDFINIGGDILVLIIFSFIGINMIIESIKNEKVVDEMRIKEMLLFGLAVSIDSFSIGIGINSISKSVFVCSLIFSLTSACFTYVGLIIGNKLNKIIGKISTILGGLTLILLGLLYFFK